MAGTSPAMTVFKKGAGQALPSPLRCKSSRRYRSRSPSDEIPNISRAKGIVRVGVPPDCLRRDCRLVRRLSIGVGPGFGKHLLQDQNCEDLGANHHEERDAPKHLVKTHRLHGSLPQSRISGFEVSDSGPRPSSRTFTSLSNSSKPVTYEPFAAAA